MRKLIEPLLYILGFTIAVKLIFKLKYAPIVLLGVVANDITIIQRFYLIGLILIWILLAGVAVLIIKNATRIGIKFMEKKIK
ncbi:hypothetical protein [Psychroserpens sp.]|uniref:hypothetical protein n=1 Tax=Psychroserpens sp. TaxID=2020870 RepID=UPI001B19730F|nr:hypothetical protein [Psychroserpens sp.]MBO6606665.1 hypothetical protein [Psychroserpens sp.]MBO6631995.1 hypothetical protein [Psychroserpens sp.]MBO6653369.1 hypothetical protein [Psychroserpens sp.]MBO6680604.1 hypothetical protein [Psychroserpens sp.]MBO6750438.1 hypothetical protein [Psychroserpens sp.]